MQSRLLPRPAWVGVQRTEPYQLRGLLRRVRFEAGFYPGRSKWAEAGLHSWWPPPPVLFRSQNSFCLQRENSKEMRCPRLQARKTSPPSGGQAETSWKARPCCEADGLRLREASPKVSCGPGREVRHGGWGEAEPPHLCVREATGTPGLE